MNKEQKITLLVAVTTAFLTTYMSSALNLSIPNIEKEFGAGAATVGWVVTAYMLAVSSINVPMGKVADAKGRRIVLISGIGLFTVSGAIAAFSVSIWMLLAMRLLQGVAGSMLFATNNAILLSVFPPEKHGTALGKSVAATYTGLSLGPVFGGILNHNFGWRSVFITSSMIGIIAFIVAVRGLSKENRKENSEKTVQYDIKGCALYIPMMMAIILGLTNLTVNRYSWMILVSGVILCLLFIRTEKRAKEPIIRIGMFTEDSVFTLSNIAALLNYGATFAISYLLSIYLQEVMGYTSRAAGLILIAQPVVMALLSPRMGKLSDRIAPYKLASGGMAVCVVGLVVLTQLGSDTPLALVIVVLLFLGLGFAMFSSPNTKAIMARVSPDDYGVANSIVATMRNMGQSFSMAVVTIVIGMTIGNASLAATSQAELLHAMKISFIVFVCLCTAATFMSLKRGE